LFASSIFWKTFSLCGRFDVHRVKGNSPVDNGGDFFEIRAKSGGKCRLIALGENQEDQQVIDLSLLSFCPFNSGAAWTYEEPRGTAAGTLLISLLALHRLAEAISFSQWPSWCTSRWRRL